ncbi:MAG: hypothetical protein K0R17_508 [Rariglobus sp.]|jgi:hypothetical protein|nr:hypothetical protein [Rariglobus sp.]
MKLSALLASRPTILRQAALAHTAAAWLTLQHASTRIAAAGLRGMVRLHQSDPAENDLPWATLTSDEIRASVLEEHFSEDDLIELAEALAHATDTSRVTLEFPIEALGEAFAAPLLNELEKAGVTVDVDGRPAGGRRN